MNENDKNDESNIGTRMRSTPFYPFFNHKN